MSNGTLPLPSLLRATAHDAGCAAMRKARRKKWSRSDYSASAEKLGRLVASAYGEGVEGWVRFQVAADLERAGHLSIRMTPKQLDAAITQAMES
jgi:hypothetical protein